MTVFLFNLQVQRELWSPLWHLTIVRAVDRVWTQAWELLWAGSRERKVQFWEQVARSVNHYHE